LYEPVTNRANGKLHAPIGDKAVRSVGDILVVLRQNRTPATVQLARPGTSSNSATSGSSGP